MSVVETATLKYSFMLKILLNFDSEVLKNKNDRLTQTY